MTAPARPFAFSPFAGPPRAAVGSFPFPHRTQGQIEAEQDRIYFAAEAVAKGPRWDTVRRAA